jgi:ABC-type multidrug transport system ATPase subunit
MLTIEGINKTYPGAVTALKDINLTLDYGLFGLLGPNGAGKSTLMRTLATLQLPDSGSVRLDAVDFLEKPRDARRLIGYLPQDMGVYPRITAREMLEYLAGLKELGTRTYRRSLVDHQLARVHLADVADRRLDTFSGGMRQRFGIAAAFLGEPKLVIVDEPTAGLDPIERRHFQLMLTESARDCVLILSSHIVEDISGLCERMALLDQGKIVLTGSPDSLVETLHGKVWEFTTSLDQLDECRRKYRVLSWRPHRGELKVRVYAENLKSISTDDQNDLNTNEWLKPAKADLEDLYAYHIEQQA